MGVTVVFPVADQKEKNKRCYVYTFIFSVSTVGRHSWQRDGQLLRHRSAIHLNTCLQLTPNLRMNGAIFPLPQYDSMSCEGKNFSLFFNFFCNQNSINKLFLIMNFSLQF